MARRRLGAHAANRRLVVTNTDVTDTLIDWNETSENVSKSEDSRETQRHKIYYFEDGNVVFQAVSESDHSTVLFCLHSSVLRKASEAFAGLFGISQPKEDDEGGTVKSPFNLEGYMSSQQMELLASAMYDGWNDDASTKSERNVVSLLEVAQKYNFNQIFIRASKHLAALNPTVVDRIVYAKRFNMDRPTWLLPAFQEIVRSLRTPSQDEIHRLGVVTSLRIVLAQQAIRDHRIWRCQNVQYTGCCMACLPVVVRALDSIALVLTESTPVDVAAQSQLVGWLRVNARSVVYKGRDARRPCAECTSWPTEEQLKEWLDWDGRELDLIKHHASFL